MTENNTKIALLVENEFTTRNLWIVKSFFTESNSQITVHNTITKRDVESGNNWIEFMRCEVADELIDTQQEDCDLKPGNYSTLTNFESWEELDSTIEFTNACREVLIFGEVIDDSVPWRLLNRQLEHPRSNRFSNLNIYLGKQLESFGFIVSDEYFEFSFEA